MAKNQSEYYLHVHGKDGELHSIGPGEDIPSWVEVDNPYVTGKATDDEAESEEDEAPKRGRARKAASDS